MDSSQNYQDLLEPGLRAAKKRLAGRDRTASPLAGEMGRKKKLKKIRAKYGSQGPGPAMPFGGPEDR